MFLFLFLELLRKQFVSTLSNIKIPNLTFYGCCGCRVDSAFKRPTNFYTVHSSELWRKLKRFQLARGERTPWASHQSLTGRTQGWATIYTPPSHLQIYISLDCGGKPEDQRESAWKHEEDMRKERPESGSNHLLTRCHLLLDRIASVLYLSVPIH